MCFPFPSTRAPGAVGRCCLFAQLPALLAPSSGIEQGRHEEEAQNATAEG